MLKGYHVSDAHLIDYEPYQLFPGLDVAFRGPRIQSDRYVACVGAAQTFGRFVKFPFPALLSSALGVDALNLGLGGVSPTLYTAHRGLKDHIDRAQLVVVQVFAARGTANALFSPIRHGIRGINRATGRETWADEFYAWLLGQDVETARTIVTETRENYVSAMTQLLDSIKVPKILFWFSVRTPKYEERFELPPWRLWGAFPQLVNDAMIERLRGHADVYVECVSNRGLPQPLFDRNGNPASFENTLMAPSAPSPKTENAYYPSPEMHQDAAALLIPACRALLTRETTDRRS